MAGNKNSGTPKAELLRLDGTQVDAEGKITKTNFFDFLNLPEGHQANLQKTLTPSQALKFRNHIVRMKIGTSAAIPMLCGGERCPVKLCPFHEERNWPIAEQCPIEAILIAEWTKSYIEDLGVDPDNRVEMVLINKLVECDMIDYRANSYLGADEESWSLLKQNTTVTPQATTTTTNIHPILEAKDKAHKIRKDILESFAATRKESYKKAAALKKREDEDIGKYFAKMKQMVNKAKSNEKPSMKEIKEDADKMAAEDAERGITNADWQGVGE